MDKQVSLYRTHADNTGKTSTYRDILLTEYKKDLPAIKKLRGLDKSAVDYKKNKIELKSSLQCYTPAALLSTKARGKVSEIHRTGIMQLDFDNVSISGYDIEELKHSVFNLPFIGFCGLSCSGEGFYALALIAEPYRLNEYAEHCFYVFSKYGVSVDTSKGKKIENLRYLSYDSDMLIREDPQPLKIKHFKSLTPIKNSENKIIPVNIFPGINNNSNLINAKLRMLQEVREGHRWETVQRVAYTLGGLCDPNLLAEIKNAINCNPEFFGDESKYEKCAEVCFSAGSNQPI